MRTLLIILLVLVAGLIGYAYYRDPVGCKNVATDIANKSDLRKDLKEVIYAVLGVPPAGKPAVSIADQTDSDQGPPPPKPTPPPPPKPVVFVRPSQWMPPAVLPAQANWAWTTSDGTYQNVVITKLGPETVSISHSLGIANDIPIVNLPPEIQTSLSYDPTAAAVARKERRREEEHPYYRMAQKADAQAAAVRMHWPLAWFSAFNMDFDSRDSDPTRTKLTLTMLNFLKQRTIIVLINPATEMPLTPDIVHHQFSARDDGVLPGNANYLTPKVVFSTPDATTILGRVSYTQVDALGEAALSDVYNSFKFEPVSSADSTTNAASASTASSTPASTSPQYPGGPPPH